jgi:hypothetical protein
MINFSFGESTAMDHHATNPWCASRQQLADGTKLLHTWRYGRHSLYAKYQMARRKCNFMLFALTAMSTISSVHRFDKYPTVKRQPRQARNLVTLLQCGKFPNIGPFLKKNRPLTAVSRRTR